jgi:hypothetical protein
MSFTCIQRASALTNEVVDPVQDVPLVLDNKFVLKEDVQHRCLLPENVELCAIAS